MIAKAKAISYGINDLRYITGESKHKKHPEKIYRVLDNLLPPDLDAMGTVSYTHLDVYKRQTQTGSKTNFCTFVPDNF